MNELLCSSKRGILAACWCPEPISARRTNRLVVTCRCPAPNLRAPALPRQGHVRQNRLAFQVPTIVAASHPQSGSPGDNRQPSAPSSAAGHPEAVPQPGLDGSASSHFAITPTSTTATTPASETAPQAPLQPRDAVTAGLPQPRLSDYSPADASTSSARAPAQSGVQLAFSTAAFALPLAAQNILGYSLNALSESLVGRLGPSTLSASTLANSSYSLAGLSLVWGGAAGMETLCGQAFGAGNLRLMRLVLLRAVLVCWAVCVPVVALWGNAEPLLLALGQSPDLVVQAAGYLKALAPAMYWYILTECLQTYLVVQGLVRPAVVAKAVVTLLGPAYYYVCMFWLDLGLVGAGYAYGLVKATNAVLLLGYLAWRWMRGGGTGKDEEGREGAAAAPPAVKATAADGESAGSGDGGTGNASGGGGGGRLKVGDLLYAGGGGGTASGWSGGVDVQGSGGASAGSGVVSSSSRERAAAAAAAMFGVGLDQGAGKSGRAGVRPNAHEEVLTSPLSAAASAHEFSIGTPRSAAAVAAAGAAAAAAAASRTKRTAVDVRAAPAAASAAAAVAVAAAGQHAAATGSGLYNRIRRAAAAVRAEAAEVLDPPACLQYIKFGLPAAVMSCLEWWAYEALVIMAGWLPDAHVSLGCLGICLTVSGWVYMVPQAISTATCTRVSNALGAGDAALAKRTFQSAYCLVLMSQLAISACLLPNAARVAAFFCPDPAAAALTSTLLPITAINVIGDGLNAVLNGILRACGRQSLGARLHLMAYWCCGLPAAYAAAFHLGLGVRGFVMAIGATSFVQSLVVGAVISSFDWEGEVRNSQALLSTISSTSSTSSIDTGDQVAEDPAVAAAAAAAAAEPAPAPAAAAAAATPGTAPAPPDHVANAAAAGMPEPERGSGAGAGTAVV